MADMYSIVKKQDEKIDDLLKVTNRNNEMLGSIDTRLAAMPQQSASVTPALPDTIQVELPPNIATNESVGRLVAEALRQQKIDVTKTLDFSTMGDAIAKSIAGLFKEGLDDSVAKALRDGIHREFDCQISDIRGASKELNRRMYNLLNGAVWAAIPKCVYAVFVGVVLFGVGLGICCNHLYKQNSYLQNVEWLYRYERGLYNNHNLVIPRERLFLHGTNHERDSLKSLVRNTERNHRADTTFINYYPTDK